MSARNECISLRKGNSRQVVAALVIRSYPRIMSSKVEFWQINPPPPAPTPKYKQKQDNVPIVSFFENTTQKLRLGYATFLPSSAPAPTPTQLGAELALTSISTPNHPPTHAPEKVKSEY